MTATDTSTWQACRHCGTPIRPSESGTCWVDAGGWDNCPDQECSHDPGACRVVDLDLTWGDILEGDLVLHAGQREEVRHVGAHVPGKLRIAFRDPKQPLLWVKHRDPVAVRRYITEET